MNASQNQRGGAAPVRGRGGAVRGGGRGVTTGARNASAANAAKAKIGPSRVLESAWVEDPALKGQSFVIFVGSGKTTDQQMTYHHPIGVTPHSGKVWVATPTSEISLLLARRTSEELTRWNREAQVAIRLAVISDGIGRKMTNGPIPVEVWDCEGSPRCGATIQTAMAEAKAADKQEADWQQFVSNEIKSAEAAFKKELASKERLATYEAAHPRPAFETRGGPLWDRPQRPLPFLGELPLVNAEDLILSVICGRTAIAASTTTTNADASSSTT